MFITIIFALSTAILLLLLCRFIVSFSLNFTHLLSICSWLRCTSCFPITVQRKNTEYFLPRLATWIGCIPSIFSPVSSSISRYNPLSGSSCSFNLPPGSIHFSSGKSSLAASFTIKNSSCWFSHRNFKTIPIQLRWIKTTLQSFMGLSASYFNNNAVFSYIAE